MKTVTVTYNGNPSLQIDPLVVVVDAEDAIQFERGEPPGVPRVGKFRLTFTETEFFHTDNADFAERGHLHEDGGLVHVRALTRKTTYRCELLGEKDVVLASSDHHEGGAVEPVPHDK